MSEFSVRNRDNLALSTLSEWQAQHFPSVHLACQEETPTESSNQRDVFGPQQAGRHATQLPHGSLFQLRCLILNKCFDSPRLQTLQF